MAKYSTDSDTGDRTQWRSDTEHVLAEWSDKPFVDYKKRNDRVEHRIVVQYHDGVGVDIRHEVRSEAESNGLPAEWTLAEDVEVREYGAFHERHLAGWFR